MQINGQNVTFRNADDEELRRRMEIAKQQGWSDEQIQRSALIEKTVQKQQQAQQKPAPQQTPKKQGTFSANKPVGFGLSLLPFGEILRKKAAGENISGGDVALDTALSVVPFAGKLLSKGAKAAKNLTTTAKSADTAVKSGVPIPEKQQLVKTFVKGEPEKGIIAGNLTKAGEALKAQARGAITGVKPQGAAEKLLPSQADEINKTLNTVERGKSILGRTKTGAKGSVNKQLRTVETAQQKALSEMDSILANQNKPVVKKDVNEILNAMRTDRKDILGLTPVHIKEAKDLEKRVAGAKDVQTLEKLRRSADDRINFARNPVSPDPALEKVYLSLRRNIDKKSTSLVPDLKAAKTNYGKLESAKDTLIQSSPATMRQFAGQGPVARVMGGGVAQNLVDKAGRTLTRAGKIQASPITKEAQVRAPFSVAGAFGASQPQEVQGEELPANIGDVFPGSQNPDEDVLNQLSAAGITDPQEMFDALSGQGNYAAPGTRYEDGSVAGSDIDPDGGIGLSSAELLKQAYDLRLAGDVKGAKDILDFAKVAADFEKESGAGKGTKVSSAQQKDLGKLGAAENVINQIEQGLGSAGLQNSGPLARVTGVARNAGQAVGLDEQARIFKSQREGYLASLAKSLGEVGSLSDQDIKRARELIPGLGDTQREAQEKIRRLRELISNNKQTVLSAPQSTGGFDDISSMFNQKGAF